MELLNKRKLQTMSYITKSIYQQKTQSKLQKQKIKSYNQRVGVETNIVHYKQKNNCKLNKSQNKMYRVIYKTKSKNY